MRCKMLTAAAAVLLMLTAGCSTLEKVVYRPDINQGNYLTPNDVSKIRVGMTQQQVAYALGTPMMSDPFGTNTWFYVFRQQPGHEDGHDPVAGGQPRLAGDDLEAGNGFGHGRRARAGGRPVLPILSGKGGV